MAKEFECPKCGYNEANTKKITASGTGLTRMFDMETNDFQVIYCARCGYAEFYVLSGGLDLPDLPL